MKIVVKLYDLIRDAITGETTYRGWDKETGELKVTLRNLNKPLEKATDDDYWFEEEE
ncbi:MAG: hypothetical protein HC874_26475 [Richelia sp. SL_2_1]|nr:hypothetical protein [Richelia sp. SM2_1_7]NJM21761.1 hypothetical protein [Richelia sp. SM1_7_0]NJN12343.1 hypothetical protein [Richelia sp. RM1_1_1]NJO30693.1 hypothetical protein [Richelia sp. SL_2_1]